jgi:hypothetical protein
MTRLGLRLALAGGREALTRLALIAVAVTVGSALLLTTLAGIHALRAQNERYAWLETGFTGAVGEPSHRASVPGHDRPSEDGGEGGGSHHDASGDPLFWLLRADTYQGTRIGRVDLAATGPASPVPPGIPGLPAPGEYYASPAMAELLGDVPAAELADRYPGTLVGLIGPEALPSPDSLLIVVGRTVEEATAPLGAQLVDRISTTPPDACGNGCALDVGTDADGMTLVLSVVAAALLFPVLVFIGAATRLSAARREQRFAAMRLVGATPRQVSRLATVESVVATAMGVAGGFALFAALRPAIATIPFSGSRFFPSDLTPSPLHSAAVAVGVPLAAALAARVALRRLIISPLGVSRRVTPAPPRAWRLVPLLGGLGWLAFLAFATDIAAERSSTTQAWAYLLGVFTIMTGLVVAGPWLTMVLARLTARHARRPDGLIAARRLGDDPRGAFRAVSGVVLGTFVATCAIAIITTITAYNAGAAGDTANAAGSLVLRFAQAPEMAPPPLAIDGATQQELASTPGVEGVVAVRVAGQVRPDQRPRNVASCAEVARAPALGRCAAGATAAAIELSLGGAVVATETPMSARRWPDAGLTDAQLQALAIDTIVVSTDGSTTAVERARTVLERRYPETTAFAPMTLSEFKARSSKQLADYRRLADVVLLTSLPIAGCSLAVAVAGGLAERRRPFSLLRLTGAPLAVLRRVVTLEAAVPLLASVVVAVVAGFAAAALFLRAQLDEALQAPGAPYYLLVGGGVAASLAIIASTLPLLRRLTGPETARNT